MEYVTALEIAHKDKAPFVEFIADCVVSTQEDLLRLLKNSGGVNLQQAPHRTIYPKVITKTLEFLLVL